MTVRHRVPAWPLRLVRAVREAPWLVALAALGIALAALLVVLGALDRDEAQQATEDRQQTEVVLDDTEGQRDAAVGQVLSLAAQVQQACDTGQLPPTDRLCTEAAEAQAEPIPGRAGIDGQDGADGRDGRDGIDGQSPPCLSTPSACQGADGRDGVDGQDGIDGQSGQDGADGADGQDGQDGRPPAGFTFVDEAGRTQTCTRDPASPDEAATYTCTAQDGGPTPSGLRLTAWG